MRLARELGRHWGGRVASDWEARLCSKQCQLLLWHCRAHGERSDSSLRVSLQWQQQERGETDLDRAAQLDLAVHHAALRPLAAVGRVMVVVPAVALRVLQRRPRHLQGPALP